MGAAQSFNCSNFNNGNRCSLSAECTCPSGIMSGTTFTAKLFRAELSSSSESAGSLFLRATGAASIKIAPTNPLGEVVAVFALLPARLPPHLRGGLYRDRFQCLCRKQFERFFHFARHQTGQGWYWASSRFSVAGCVGLRYCATNDESDSRGCFPDASFSDKLLATTSNAEAIASATNAALDLKWFPAEAAVGKAGLLHNVSDADIFHAMQSKHPRRGFKDELPIVFGLFFS